MWTVLFINVKCSGHQMLFNDLISEAYPFLFIKNLVKYFLGKINIIHCFSLWHYFVRIPHFALVQHLLSSVFKVIEGYPSEMWTLTCILLCNLTLVCTYSLFTVHYFGLMHCSTKWLYTAVIWYSFALGLFLLLLTRYHFSKLSLHFMLIFFHTWLFR